MQNDDCHGSSHTGGGTARMNKLATADYCYYYAAVRQTLTRIEAEMKPTVPKMIKSSTLYNYIFNAMWSGFPSNVQTADR
jgi:hypothetical protein